MIESVVQCHGQDGALQLPYMEDILRRFIALRIADTHGWDFAHGALSPVSNRTAPHEIFRLCHQENRTRTRRLDTGRDNSNRRDEYRRDDNRRDYNRRGDDGNRFHYNNQRRYQQRPLPIDAPPHDRPAPNDQAPDRQPPPM